MATRITFIVLFATCALGTGKALGVVIIYPTKDGTLVDGGAFGTYDGVADDADWTFNETSYEGTITLTTSPALEHRVVWEYSLSTVSLEPPVSAILHFTVRPAPLWPRPEVDVHVYAYPADLVEDESDYNATPAVLQGSVAIEGDSWPPPPAAYQLDVAAEVSGALISGTDMVAFRFQIDPGTPHPANQAFIDALDSDETTKPYLVIDEAPPGPGDFNGDGRVNLLDFATFAVCFGAPITAPPPDCSLEEAAIADLDGNGVVNLLDFATFAVVYTD